MHKGHDTTVVGGWPTAYHLDSKAVIDKLTYSQRILVDKIEYILLTRGKGVTTTISEET